MNATTETAILSRVFEPLSPDFSTEFARTIMALDFSAEDRAEMARLSERARQGTLTPEEKEEIDRYERVGHFLSLMKSKARRALKSSSS